MPVRHASADALSHGGGGGGGVGACMRNICARACVAWNKLEPKTGIDDHTDRG